MEIVEARQPEAECQICGKKIGEHKEIEIYESIRHPFIDSTRDLSSKVAILAYFFVCEGRKSGHDYIPPIDVAWLLYQLLPAERECAVDQPKEEAEKTRVGTFDHLNPDNALNAFLDLATRVTKLEKHRESLIEYVEGGFEEDGTVFVCKKCGSVADIVITHGGVQPGTPNGPEMHWGEGWLICESCNIKDGYSCSS